MIFPIFWIRYELEFTLLFTNIIVIGGQPVSKKQDNFSENMDFFTLA